jgi:hypothetical protein
MATIPSHPSQRWFLDLRPRLRNGRKPGALDRNDMSLSTSVTPAVGAILCLGSGTGGHELCVTQGDGIADPFVDDLSTGQGIVLGRAATKLRSIEIQPLTGGSTGRRPADPRHVEGTESSTLVDVVS